MAPPGAAISTLVPVAPAGPRQVAVSTYAWADNDATVKIYVELPGLDSVDDTAVQLAQPDASAIDLRVTLSEAVHVLRLGPLYNEVASATVKRSAKRITVTLRKTEEGKAFKWYSLLGDSKPSKAALQTVSPLSTAGEDFDLAAAMNTVSPGLGDEDGE